MSTRHANRNSAARAPLLRMLLATSSATALLAAAGPVQAAGAVGRLAARAASRRRLLAATSLASLAMGAALVPTGSRPADAACTIAVTGASGPVVNASTVDCISFTNATVTGLVNNTGSITTGGISFVNSTITPPAGLTTNAASFVGGINIDSTSAITAGGGSTELAVLGTTFAGGITNAGTLSGGNFGIRVDSLATFSGGITNSGSVSAGAVGLFVQDIADFTGGVTNTGTITAATGILLNNMNGLTVFNSGNITGTGGTAIDLAGALSAMTINQTGGTITGAIQLSNNADVFNISGGTIDGNILGGLNAGVRTGTVNFALGSGTFTHDDSILGVRQINVESGLVILNGNSNNVVNSTTRVAINGGTLVIGDELNPAAILRATGGYTVEAGGTLAGYGSVFGGGGETTLRAGGTLAPGMPGGAIGTLTVLGDLGVAAGSFYRVEVDAAGQSSRVDTMNGAAFLTGGTVQVVQRAGSYAPSTTYTILTGQSGVDGAFDGATTNSTFFTPSLSYVFDQNLGANSTVLLTLTQNAFTSAARTPNQQGVAAALDASDPAGTLPQALLALTSTAGAEQAFDALSGEIHASIGGVLNDESRYMRQAMLGRMRQFGSDGAPGAMASLGVGGPVLAYAPPAAATFPADAMAADFPVKAPPRAPAAPGVTWWAQGLGAWGRADGDGNAARLDRQVAGVITGVDMPVANGWRAGLAAGYTQSQIDVSGRSSSATVDNGHFGAYAGGRLGAFNLRTGAAIAWHSLDVDRSVVFPGFTDQVTARYDAYTGQIFGEIGYGVSLAAVAFEPFAGLAWASRHTDAFTETGGAAALSAAATNENIGYSSLGLRAATTVDLGRGMVLVPHGSIAWQHAFGDVSPKTAFSFVGAGTAFTAAGLPIARDSALVDVGADIVVRPNITLGLSYVGQLANSAQDHAAKGKATWRF